MVVPAVATDIFSTVGVLHAVAPNPGITMARSDDGEFELILGNRQLLGVFFVIVMLLGVFFAMGYIVGKNSVSADVLAAKKADPIMLDPTKPRTPPDSGTVVVPKPAPATESKPEDPGGRISSPPAEPDRRDPRPSGVEQPPKPSAEQKAKPAGAETGAPAAEPLKGQYYLQVVASTREDCDIIAGVLQRKGFAAAVAAGPNPTLFRVLVGPLENSAAINKVKEDLEQAGFSKPYLRKF
jgi:cell division protein FtsN